MSWSLYTRHLLRGVFQNQAGPDVVSEPGAGKSHRLGFLPTHSSRELEINALFGRETGSRPWDEWSG